MLWIYGVHGPGQKQNLGLTPSALHISQWGASILQMTWTWSWFLGPKIKQNRLVPAWSSNPMNTPKPIKIRWVPHFNQRFGLPWQDYHFLSLIQVSLGLRIDQLYNSCTWLVAMCFHTTNPPTSTSRIPQHDRRSFNITALALPSHDSFSNSVQSHDHAYTLTWFHGCYSQTLFFSC